MKIASLSTNGWLDINDIATVSDELLSGYLTTLEGQSIMGGAGNPSKTGKISSFVHDLHKGNNNPDELIDSFTNSLTTIFTRYYPNTQVSVRVKEVPETSNLSIYISIIINHNGVEYNVGSEIATLNGKVQEYSNFTKNANLYRQSI